MENVTVTFKSFRQISHKYGDPNEPIQAEVHFDVEFGSCKREGLTAQLKVNAGLVGHDLDDIAFEAHGLPEGLPIGYADFSEAASNYYREAFRMAFGIGFGSVTTMKSNIMKMARTVSLPERRQHDQAW